MTERVIACLSGGVDSSVAAALLQEAGHEVIGVFMRSGVSGETTGEKQGCCSVEDAMDARRVADQLGIPFYALNMEAEFDRLIDRFVGDYAQGRTPNPCVLCNRWLKLGHVLRFARKVGATRVATGHYARVVQHAGRWTLERPRDRRKDQSYVLAVLEQSQLASTILPLGDLTKDEVRAQAEARGLFRVAGKRDSQEICFVSDDYRDLLRERLPPETPALQPGEIQHVDGTRLGSHPGAAGYTVGQRKGLGVAATKPLYVVRTEPARRLVVVGAVEDLDRADLTAGDVTWLGRRLEPGESTEGRAQIRAHGASHPVTVQAVESDVVTLTFHTPVRAITPGQAVVVYDPDDTWVQLSGWIR